MDILIKKTFLASVFGVSKDTETDKEQTKVQEILSLKEEVARLNRDIKIAESKLELISDEDLIEAQIFEIRALKARYSHFIKKAKLLSEPSFLKG